MSTGMGADLPSQSWGAAGREQLEGWGSPPPVVPVPCTPGDTAGLSHIPPRTQMSLSVAQM